MLNQPSRIRCLLAIPVVVLLMAAVSSGPRAQSPATADRVSVSFLAVGRDGRPILDLKPEEVQLRVDGRQRTVKSLDRIDATSSGDAVKPTGPPLPAPFGSNVGGAGVTGRTTFLIIDDGSFRPGNERLMKQAIESFLGTVPPTDRVALLTTPLSSVRTDPTTPAAVREALARVAAHGSAVPTDDGGLARYQNDAACRTREVLEAMRGLLSNLAGSTIPPTVIFFSSGISATTRTTGNLGTSNCDLSTDAFQNVGAAAAAARAHVYVVQADLTAAAEERRTREPRRRHRSAGPGPGWRRREPAEPHRTRNLPASYLATFEPEPSERNGQPHRLELRVTRPDVTVRAGTQIPIARRRRQERAQGSQRARHAAGSDRLSATCRCGSPPFPRATRADKLKLVALGDVADPAAKLTAAVVGVYDAKGKLTRSRRRHPNRSPRMPLMFAVVVPPAAYRIRLAATDAAGRERNGRLRADGRPRRRPARSN